MSVKINDCLNVIGVAGITVSQIDDTLFIANDRLTTFGVPNSVAIYSDEFGNIKSTGVTIDNDNSTLTADNIVANTIKVEQTTSKLNQSSIMHSNSYYLTVDDNKLEDNIVARLGTYQYNNKHKFGIFLKKNNTEYSTSISIDQSSRVSVEDGRLNLRKQRTITSAIGERGDVLGDIAIDHKYLYYCHTSYNGKTPIWVRWKVSDIDW